MWWMETKLNIPQQCSESPLLKHERDKYREKKVSHRISFLLLLDFLGGVCVANKGAGNTQVSVIH